MAACVLALLSNATVMAEFDLRGNPKNAPGVDRAGAPGRRSARDAMGEYAGDRRAATVFAPLAPIGAGEK